MRGGGVIVLLYYEMRGCYSSHCIMRGGGVIVVIVL